MVKVWLNWAGTEAFTHLILSFPNVFDLSCLHTYSHTHTHIHINTARISIPLFSSGKNFLLISNNIARQRHRDKDIIWKVKSFLPDASPSRPNQLNLKIISMSLQKKKSEYVFFIYSLIKTDPTIYVVSYFPFSLNHLSLEVFVSSLHRSILLFSCLSFTVLLTQHAYLLHTHCPHYTTCHRDWDSAASWAVLSTTALQFLEETDLFVQ